MWIEMFDAGTTLNIDPLVSIPGMDSGYFRELDLEYQWPGERQSEINQDIVEAPFVGTYRPWPQPFTWRMWMDWTERHRGDYGGPQFTLYNWDDFAGDFAPVGAPISQVEADSNYDAGANVEDTRMGDWMTQEEIREAAGTEEPATWLRRPLYNEAGGKYYYRCELENPVVITQHHHSGPHYKLAGDYNPIYMPFDMRHPEWYEVIGEDGTPINLSASRLLKEQLCSILNDSSYRFYLRPANWRWTATVKAYYYYISWFEFFLTSQVFTQAHFNRPPIYPYRHDLINTSRYTSVEWDHVWWSTDDGIDYGFNSSRSAGWLRHQIVDAQWWTYSEAYIFARNDPAKLIIWLWPPEAGDIVFGIGNVDHITGSQQTVWFKQVVDLTDEFPRTVLGNYLVMDFIAAGED